VTAVTEAEAASDRAWFAQNPYRRYRIRRAGDDVWLIRRRAGGVLLRTRTANLPGYFPDTDTALRTAWVDTAWAGLTPSLRNELAKEIKKGEKLHEL
jgi:hypothetical protein